MLLESWIQASVWRVYNTQSRDATEYCTSSMDAVPGSWLRLLALDFTEKEQFEQAKPVLLSKDCVL